MNEFATEWAINCLRSDIERLKEIILQLEIKIEALNMQQNKNEYS